MWSDRMDDMPKQTKRQRLARIKKSLFAGLAAAAGAAGAGLAEGADWRAAAGMGLAAGLVAGLGTWKARNQLGTAELRELVDEAIRTGRP